MERNRNSTSVIEFDSVPSTVIVRLGQFRQIGLVLNPVRILSPSARNPAVHSL